MTMVAVRKVVGGLLVGGFGVACALTGTSAAAAGVMNSPLLNSTCSFGQIDRALRAVRPDLAARLDANPQGKARLQQLMDLPVPQRKAAIQQWINQHPDQVAHGRQWEAAHPGEMNQRLALGTQLAGICHNY
jgi:hemophore-related protein